MLIHFILIFDIEICEVYRTYKIKYKVKTKCILHFQIFFKTHLQMFTGRVYAEIARQRLDIISYVALFQPALDWIMHALAAEDSDVILDTIIKQSHNKKNKYAYLNKKPK